MKFNCKEDIIQITPLWKGERMEDGRPKVSADVLRRLRKITLEEAWGPLWQKGYKYQFEGEFRTTHPGATLVGRAVTGVYVPMRPDLNDYLLKYGHEEEGRKGYFNQWVIDSLVEDDGVVVFRVVEELLDLVAADITQDSAVAFLLIKPIGTAAGIFSVRTHAKYLDHTANGTLLYQLSCENSSFYMDSLTVVNHVLSAGLLYHLFCIFQLL